MRVLPGGAWASEVLCVFLVLAFFSSFADVLRQANEHGVGEGEEKRRRRTVSKGVGSIKDLTCCEITSAARDTPRSSCSFVELSGSALRTSSCCSLVAKAEVNAVMLFRLAEEQLGPPQVEDMPSLLPDIV